MVFLQTLKKLRKSFQTGTDLEKCYKNSAYLIQWNSCRIRRSENGKSKIFQKSKRFFEIWKLSLMQSWLIRSWVKNEDQLFDSCFWLKQMWNKLKSNSVRLIFRQKLLTESLKRQRWSQKLWLIQVWNQLFSHKSYSRLKRIYFNLSILSKPKTRKFYKTEQMNKHI